MGKYSLEVVFDYVGYPDCYSGHGHSFTPEDVVACVRFGFPVNYKETIQDIIERVIEDIDRYIDPIEFLQELSPEEEEEVAEFLSDENIKQAILETLGYPDLNEPFFDDPLYQEFAEEIEDLEEEDEMIEYPMLIGYIHVWRED